MFAQNDFVTMQDQKEEIQLWFGPTWKKQTKTTNHTCPIPTSTWMLDQLLGLGPRRVPLFSSVFTQAH